MRTQERGHQQLTAQQFQTLVHVAGDVALLTRSSLDIDAVRALDAAARAGPERAKEIIGKVGNERVARMLVVAASILRSLGHRVDADRTDEFARSVRSWQRGDSRSTS